MTKKIPDQSTKVLLDKFSTLDMAAWQRREEDFQAFHIGLFYYLEGKRALHHKILCEVLNDSKPVSIKVDDWCRTVDYQYSLAPLSSIGSMKMGGRFNIGGDIDPQSFPPFPALYIAEDYEAAYAEKFGTTVHPEVANGLTGHELALRKPASFSSVKLRLDINNVFDLTRAVNLKHFVQLISSYKMPANLVTIAKRLGIKPPYLVKDVAQLRKVLLDKRWKHHPTQLEIPANSQVFGRLLRDSGFQGVLYPSTKATGKNCIALFTENISGSDSFVELMDTPPAGVKCTKLCSDNWSDGF